MAGVRDSSASNEESLSAVQQARELAQSIVDTVRDAFVILDADLRVVSANRFFYQSFRVTPAETEGRLLYDLGNRQWDIPKLRELLEDVLPQHCIVEAFDVTHDFPDIGRRIMRLNARQMSRAPTRSPSILLAIEDVTEHRRAEEALRKNEERFRTLYLNTPGMLHSINREARLVSVSDHWLETMGYERSDVLGRKLTDFMPEASRRYAQEVGFQEFFETGRVKELPYQLTKKNGDVIDVLLSATAQYDQRGKFHRSLAVIVDITQRKRTEAALKRSEQRFRDFAETAGDYFWEVGPDLKFTFVSGQLKDVIGLSADQILGQYRPELFARHVTDAGKQKQHCADLEARRSFEDFEYEWKCSDGTTHVLRNTAKPIFDEQGDFQGYRGAVLDVTEGHKLSEQLSYQATHDALTGLVNRREFEKRLQRVLETVRREGGEHALCYLDLDQFKVINDTCGHVAGDELLRELAAVLREQVRERDTLARLGGDEFGVLTEHCALNQAQRVANALREAIGELPFVWEDKSFSIGVSIGLVPITAASQSITALLSAADAACYAAKDKGRNRIHVYREADTELARRHSEMHWVGRINRALQDDRFRLYAQPIAPVRGDADEGAHYELLLRMEDEDGDIVEPGAFLPAAERYNLLTKIDRWVIQSAFRWLNRYPKHLERLCLCEINLSGHSLTDYEFLNMAMEELDRAEVAPNKICFEVTETAAIANLASATRFIQTLMGRGCRFALDDFGSGFSSFAYLKTLPVDFLKIDGMFVKDIVEEPFDLQMVKSINEIAHVMGKRTIAEFVENAAILEKLKPGGIGVDYVQGYGVGAPRPIEDLLNDAAHCDGS